MHEGAVQTEWVLVPEGSAPPKGQTAAGERQGAPRLKAVNRQQLVFRAVDVELLIEEDHPARAIWAFMPLRLYPLRTPSRSPLENRRAISFKA